uniref:Uncharacterized protein n=1 Tax=Pyxicephalus adspersus TaxID=30357 RepID=A0AAV3B2L3_PYXAD|nr:TPA: hypothetical protein GDO54_009578 [Pyxicephalus adspersus]
MCTLYYIFILSRVIFFSKIQVYFRIMEFPWFDGKKCVLERRGRSGIWNADGPFISHLLESWLLTDLLTALYIPDSLTQVIELMGLLKVFCRIGGDHEGAWIDQRSSLTFPDFTFCSAGPR